MKYWWLKKYRNLKVILLPELIKDINFFLVMPNNVEKYYKKIKDKDINDLTESEMLIVLYNVVNTKNLKDNKARVIIDKLLEIKDNSFPPSDYSLTEILDEIFNLETNIPHYDKLNTNNVAICYNCLNVFYVDQIISVNKNKICLCPYCLSKKMYFDNDYIPMNYIFIKLSNIYYRTSKLGCSFRNVQKMLSKNIKVEEGKKTGTKLNLTSVFPKGKRTPQDEKIIHKKIYDQLIKSEERLEHDIDIYIGKLNSKNSQSDLLITVISIIDILSNCVYLKNIKITTNSNNKKELDSIIKTVIKSK